MKKEFNEKIKFYRKRGRQCWKIIIKYGVGLENPQIRNSWNEKALKLEVLKLENQKVRPT